MFTNRVQQRALEAASDHFGQDIVERALNPSSGAVEGTYIQITPKMREEYNRLKQKFGSVFPAYKRGGKVDGKSKIRYNKPEHALKIARKYAQ
jgi:hypothetical protein